MREAEANRVLLVTRNRDRVTRIKTFEQRRKEQLLRSSVQLANASTIFKSTKLSHHDSMNYVSSIPFCTLY